VKELWIFIEGGGSKGSRDQLRQAFGEFLAGPREAAREKGVPWRIVMCGSRDDTFKAFRNAFRERPGAHLFLLVDAEGEVSDAAREHLAARDPWDLSIAGDDQCHLMAQVMESWFLADPDALARFYGQQFGGKQIPARKNVEEVPKPEVEAALKNATAKTQKGEYHKIRHGPQILESLDPDRVRKRAPHCERLFEKLDEALA
jgi:hypothetical protein